MGNRSKRKKKKKKALKRKKLGGQKRIAKRRGHSRSRPQLIDFPEGLIIAKKYQVGPLLGRGWEGEVYRLTELSTGIERAGKFFYPRRNLHNRTLKLYAKKLHRLRSCPIVIQYHTQEMIWYRGIRIPFLVSEFVEGELLSTFLERQPGGRLHFFQAVHLLHSLAQGIEKIHQLKEYHGDLHSDNIIVRGHGLGFDLKLLDMFWWGAEKPRNIHFDVISLIQVFHEALGGARFYNRQPQAVKDICSGLKETLILKKFRNSGELKEYLETMDWS